MTKPIAQDCYDFLMYSSSQIFHQNINKSLQSLIGHDEINTNVVMLFWLIFHD